MYLVTLCFHNFCCVADCWGIGGSKVKGKEIFSNSSFVESYVTTSEMPKGLGWLNFYSGLRGLIQPKEN